MEKKEQRVPDEARRRLIRMAAYTIPAVLTLGMTRSSRGVIQSPR